MKRLLLVCAFVFLGATSLQAQDITVTAPVSVDKIDLHELVIDYEENEVILNYSRGLVAGSYIAVRPEKIVIASGQLPAELIAILLDLKEQALNRLLVDYPGTID